MSEENQQQKNEDVKLYAGKFKTIEDLEQGYKNSAAVYDENVKLKSKVEELTALPSEYKKPDGVQLDDTYFSDLQQKAKEAGLTQSQFEKYVSVETSRTLKQKEAFENAKKEVGDANLNVLKDFVNQHYPKEIAESIINSAIINKEARQAILNQREKALNSRLPGEGSFNSPGHQVTDEDIRKAHAQKEKTNSITDINKYINLIAQKAKSRK